MRRQPYFEIFAASLSAILLEIAYTRIFSFKVYYYFTYLIIGIGMMGLGAGGVLVAISRRLREMDPERLISVSCTAGGAAGLFGYFVVALTQINASALSFELIETLKLLVICVLLTLPFLAVGIIVATILSGRPESAGRLYAADLVGAGLGCTMSIPLFLLLDPPRTVILSAFVLTLGGLRFSLPSRPRLIAAALFLAAALLPVFVPSLLPDPIVDRSKGFEDFRREGLIQYSEWNPVFRVDVADHPVEMGDLYLLFHDASPGSGMRRYDSERSAFSHLSNDSRKLPFEVLDRERPNVLIIGSAGGHEVVASLVYGAGHVTGVELNSTTLSLLTDTYADLTGRLHENPRVTFVNGDGRWFLKASEEEYDIIWLVAPDSYAAMNASTSGAFVLAESYLYTVEMVRTALQHLAHGGILCAQFGEFNYDVKPNRTLRFLATARKTYYEDTIPDFDKRVLVATATGLPPFLESTVLLSRQELRPDQIARFERHVEERVPEGNVRYTPHRTPDASQVHQVILIPSDLIANYYREHPYLIDPVRDDSPFFWHFARFADAFMAPAPAQGQLVDFEDSIGERVLFILLGIAIVLGGLFLMTPMWRIRRLWTQIPQKAHVGAYFGALGIGFMFIEIGLIQKLTLFLGYPTRSLSVTLFSLLVFSGLGSFASSRYAHLGVGAVGRLLAALVALTSAWFLVAPGLLDRFVGSALPLRILLAVVMIAPFGLCLGGFLPVGIAVVSRLSEHRREIVAWAWAVNAFLSVVSSILAAILAMVVSFKLLLIMAPVIYAAGAVALTRAAMSASAEQPTN